MGGGGALTEVEGHQRREHRERLLEDHVRRHVPGKARKDSVERELQRQGLVEDPT